jgi:hypothetical protein
MAEELGGSGASAYAIGEGAVGAGDGVGPGETEFVAAGRGLGVTDGTQTGRAADLNISHGVPEEHASGRRLVEEVEGSDDRVRMRLHQFRPTRNTTNKGVDQVPEVVAVEERFNGWLRVVTDDHHRPANLSAGFEEVDGSGGRLGNRGAGTSPSVLT